MRKSMKLMSMLLAVALVVAVLPTAAFAAEEPDDKPIEFSVRAVSRLLADTVDATPADVQRINSNMEMLHSLGLVYEKDQVKKIALSEDGPTEYTIEVAGAENVVTISEIPGGIRLTGQEGSIKNVMLMYDDGRCYVDGILLEAFSSSSEENTVMPMSMEYWQPNAPYYGKESDYSNAVMVESSKDIQLPKTLDKMSNAIAVATIGTLLTHAPGVGIVVGVISAGSGDLLGHFVSYAKEWDPFTDKLSYQGIRFTINGNSGFINDTYGYQYKYDFWLYTGRNFGGNAYRETWYHMILPYA